MSNRRLVYLLLAFILILGLGLLCGWIYLKYKTSEHQTTLTTTSNNTTQLVTGGAARGGFSSITKDLLTLNLKEQQIKFTVDKDTAYGCQKRTIDLPNGQQVDSLDMFMDYSQYEAPPPDINNPNRGSAGLAKFSSIIKLSDPVMVVFRAGSSGEIRLVDWVYLVSDTCSL